MTRKSNAKSTQLAFQKYIETAARRRVLVPQHRWLHAEFSTPRNRPFKPQRLAYLAIIARRCANRACQLPTVIHLRLSIMQPLMEGIKPGRLEASATPHPLPALATTVLHPTVNAGVPMLDAVNAAAVLPPTNPMANIPPQHAGLHAPRQPTNGQSSSPDVQVYLGVSDEKGMRDHQEDRHTLIPDFQVGGGMPVPRQFMAVFDGHSSSKGSEHASRRLHLYIANQTAVKECKGYAANQAEAEAMEEALKSAFLDTDEEIIEHAEKRGKRYGTTAVIALRIGGVLYVAHAGDSRAVLCRDGRTFTLTQDHKPASVPEERERIEEQGGRISIKDDRVYSNPESGHMSRLNMSRALGDAGHKAPRRLVESEPDVNRIALKEGGDRFLVLGSDGLFDVMTDEQVVAVVNGVLTQNGEVNEAKAFAAADALVRQALARRTRDNVTAAVMLFDWQSDHSCHA